MEIVASLTAQLITLQTERDAIIATFGGYRTDRLAILENQIPKLEKVMNELHDGNSEFLEV